MNKNLCTFLVVLKTYALWVLFWTNLCFDIVLCESNCVCCLLGTQCKPTRHKVVVLVLCLRDEKTW